MTTLTETKLVSREEARRETTIHLDPGMRLMERVDA